MAQRRKKYDIARGFGSCVLDEINNEGTVHHRLVRDIEVETERNLVVYMSFLRHPAGSIVPEDSGLLETMLRSMDLAGYEERLDLLLESPGGSPIAAEQIIKTCRSYSKHLRVLVTGTAMSAATLVAMGADAIAMTKTAQLGPIDPQMVLVEAGRQVMRPAAAFVDAYIDLINKSQDAIMSGRPPHPYLELLRAMDPSWIQVCLKARDLSRTIAKEYLSRFILKGTPPETVQDVVDRFMKEGEELSHGRAIRADKARDYGLPVDDLPMRGRLGEKLWELSERCKDYVQKRGFAKYFLYRAGGLNVHAKPIKL
jgi:hypothetical protein